MIQIDTRHILGDFVLSAHQQLGLSTIMSSCSSVCISRLVSQTAGSEGSYCGDEAFDRADGRLTTYYAHNSLLLSASLVQYRPSLWCRFLEYSTEMMMYTQCEKIPKTLF